MSSDLDGDGQPERVTVALREAPKRACVVTAAGVEYTWATEFDEECMIEAIDLDSSDKLKEIVLHDSSGTDYAREVFLRYQNKQWKVLGTIAATFSGQREVPGAGFVLVPDWAGFFVMRKKYVLQKEALTELVPELYSVDVKAKVQTSFALQLSRSNPEPLAKLKVGSEIQILAYAPTQACAAGSDAPFAPCALFLVRSASGLLGWVRFDVLQANAELPLAG